MSNIISFFQKLIKGECWNKSGGLENFSKIDKRGGDYLVLESTSTVLKRNIHFSTVVHSQFHDQMAPICYASFSVNSVPILLPTPAIFASLKEWKPTT